MKKLILTAALMMGLSSPAMAHKMADCQTWKPTIEQFSNMRFDNVDWDTASTKISEIEDRKVRAGILTAMDTLWNGEDYSGTRVTSMAVYSQSREETFKWAQTYCERTAKDSPDYRGDGGYEAPYLPRPTSLRTLLRQCRMEGLCQ